MIHEADKYNAAKQTSFMDVLDAQFTQPYDHQFQDHFSSMTMKQSNPIPNQPNALNSIYQTQQQLQEETSDMFPLSLHPPKLPSSSYRRSSKTRMFDALGTKNIRKKYLEVYTSQTRINSDTSDDIQVNETLNIHPSSPSKLHQVIKSYPNINQVSNYFKRPFASFNGGSRHHGAQVSPICPTVSKNHEMHAFEINKIAPILYSNTAAVFIESNNTRMKSSSQIYINKLTKNSNNPSLDDIEAQFLACQGIDTYIPQFDTTQSLNYTSKQPTIKNDSLVPKEMPKMNDVIKNLDYKSNECDNDQYLKYKRFENAPTRRRPKIDREIQKCFERTVGQRQIMFYLEEDLILFDSLIEWQSKNPEASIETAFHVFGNISFISFLSFFKL